jgi:hypothetical protein
MTRPTSVPFDWMEVKRHPDAGKAQSARREAMYRTELEDRAALLHRLGHGKDHVRGRLRANLAWDFDGGPTPVSGAQVDAIVDKVFGNAAAGRPPARGATKGGTKT